MPFKVCLSMYMPFKVHAFQGTCLSVIGGVVPWDSSTILVSYSTIGKRRCTVKKNEVICLSINKKNGGRITQRLTANCQIGISSAVCDKNPNLHTYASTRPQILIGSVILLLRPDLPPFIDHDQHQPPMGGSQVACVGWLERGASCC